MNPPPPPKLLPKSLRAFQGNPEIVVWCDVCKECTLKVAHGRCMWCDTQLNAPTPLKKGGRGSSPRWTDPQLKLAADFRRRGMSYSGIAIAMEVLFAVRLDQTYWSRLLRDRCLVPAAPRGAAYGKKAA